MATYYYSDTNATFSGAGASDTLTFSGDYAGDFDHRDFSFLKDGDNLIIYADKVIP
jgi:hypothetical protein